LCSLSFLNSHIPPLYSSTTTGRFINSSTSSHLNMARATCKNT
jgi:hypothetical protein